MDYGLWASTPHRRLGQHDSRPRRVLPLCLPPSPQQRHHPHPPRPRPRLTRLARAVALPESGGGEALAVALAGEGRAVILPPEAVAVHGHDVDGALGGRE